MLHHAQIESSVILLIRNILDLEFLSFVDFLLECHTFTTPIEACKTFVDSSLIIS